MVGFAMIPDAVEIDEFKTGVRREGPYFSLISFVQKAGCAFALWFLGVVLTWVDYVPDTTQSDLALWGIKTITGTCLPIFLLFSIVFCYLMPLTRMNHHALCDAIRKKKEGAEFDETQFSEIL